MFVFQLFNTIEIQDLEDNIGNEQSLNILCFLKPDSVSYVVRNVQFTISLAYSDDFYCFLRLSV